LALITAQHAALSRFYREAMLVGIGFTSDEQAIHGYLIQVN
jgi:hypothetical protein